MKLLIFLFLTAISVGFATELYGMNSYAEAAFWTVLSAGFLIATFITGIKWIEGEWTK